MYNLERHLHNHFMQLYSRVSCITQRENRISRAVMHVTCVSMRLTNRRVALSVIIYCNVIIFAFLSLRRSFSTKNPITYHYRIKLIFFFFLQTIDYEFFCVLEDFLTRVRLN